MDSAPFGLGFGELVFIALLALVLLGPKRLPEVGRAAGRLFAQLRRSGMELRRAFEEEVQRAEADAGDLERLKREIAGAGAQVREAGRDLLAGTGLLKPPAGPTVPAPRPAAAPPPGSGAAPAPAAEPAQETPPAAREGADGR